MFFLEAFFPVIPFPLHPTFFSIRLLPKCWLVLGVENTMVVDLEKAGSK